MRQQGCLVVDRMTGIPALPCWMRRGQTIFIKSDASVSTAYAAVRVMDVNSDNDETTWRKVYGGNISEVKATNNGSITDSVSFTYTFPEPTSKKIWMYLQMHTDYYFYDDTGKVIGYADRRTSIYYSVPVGTSKIKISADTVILKTVLVAFSEDTSNPILAPKAFRFTGRYEIDSLGLPAPVWEQLPIRTRFVRGKGQTALFDIQTGNTLNRVLPVSSVDSANSGYITTGRYGLNILGSIINAPNTDDLRVLIRKRCGNNHWLNNSYRDTRTPRVYVFIYTNADTVLSLLRGYIEDPVNYRNIKYDYPMSFTSGQLYPQFVDIAIVRIGKNSRGQMSPYIQSSDRLYYRLQYDIKTGYWEFYRK